MIIYKVTNKKNGKSYIGQTTQSLTERWWQHCHRSPSQKQRSCLFNAIQKYGEESFSIEPIDSAASMIELNIKEATYIKAFNTLSPHGYNLHLGGDARICHEETKAKISATLKGRPIANRWNKGNKVPPSPERRERIAAKLRGRPAPHNNTPVFIVETGATYPSVNACAAAMGMDRTLLLYYLRAGTQHKKLGFTFKRQEAVLN